MLPRPLKPTDLSYLNDIDATVDSQKYVHLNRTIDETGITWRLERRELRERSIDPNRISDDLQFHYRQIASGIEDGLALCIELDDGPVASLIAQPRPEIKTLHLIDLRVDFDHRREGMGMSLVCAAIAHARDEELRAITAETPTQNDPAAQLLRKLAFEPAGLDTFRFSNHDLVKERATLLWCLPLD